MYGTLNFGRVVRPSAWQIDEIHALYGAIAAEGKQGTEPEYVRLGAIAQGLIHHQGAEAILLAGTDLSSFYADRPADFPAIDVASAHIDAIVTMASA